MSDFTYIHCTDLLSILNRRNLSLPGNVAKDEKGTIISTVEIMHPLKHYKSIIERIYKVKFDDTTDGASAFYAFVEDFSAYIERTYTNLYTKVPDDLSFLSANEGWEKYMKDITNIHTGEHPEYFEKGDFIKIPRLPIPNALKPEPEIPKNDQ